MAETTHVAALQAETELQFPERPLQHTSPVGRLRRAWHALVAGAVLGMAPAALAEDAPDPASQHRKEGAVLLAGGAHSEEIDALFLKLAGGPKIVVIPSASLRMDLPEADDPAYREKYFWRLPKDMQLPQPLSVQWLHTRSRTKADEDGFVQCLQEANGVWWCGGDQGLIADTFVKTRVQDELHAIVKRGGVVGGTSAGAAIGSKIMIRGYKTAPDYNDDSTLAPELGEGFGLVDGAVVEQHYNLPGRSKRLELALKQHKDLAGLGIPERSALIFRGKIAEAFGPADVEYVPPPSRRGKAERLSVGDTVDWSTGVIRRKTRVSVPDVTVGMP